MREVDNISNVSFIVFGEELSVDLNATYSALSSYVINNSTPLSTINGIYITHVGTVQSNWAGYPIGIDGRCGPEFQRACPGFACCSAAEWCSGYSGTYSVYCYATGNIGLSGGIYDGIAPIAVTSTSKPSSTPSSPTFVPTLQSSTTDSPSLIPNIPKNWAGLPISNDSRCGSSFFRACGGTQCCSQHSFCGGLTGISSLWCSYTGNTGQSGGIYDGVQSGSSEPVSLNTIAQSPSLLPSILPTKLSLQPTSKPSKYQNWAGVPIGSDGRCGQSYGRACGGSQCCSVNLWCGGTSGIQSAWCSYSGNIGLNNGIFDGVKPGWVLPPSPQSSSPTTSPTLRPILSKASDPTSSDSLPIGAIVGITFAAFISCACAFIIYTKISKAMLMITEGEPTVPTPPQNSELEAPVSPTPTTATTAVLTLPVARPIPTGSQQFQRQLHQQPLAVPVNETHIATADTLHPLPIFSRHRQLY